MVPTLRTQCSRRWTSQSGRSPHGVGGPHAPSLKFFFPFLGGDGEWASRQRSPHPAYWGTPGRPLLWAEVPGPSPKPGRESNLIWGLVRSRGWPWKFAEPVRACLAQLRFGGRYQGSEKPASSLPIPSGAPDPMLDWLPLYNCRFCISRGCFSSKPRICLWTLRPSRRHKGGCQEQVEK